MIIEKNMPGLVTRLFFFAAAFIFYPLASYCDTNNLYIIEYVRLSLINSDHSHSLQESLQSSQLNLDTAAHTYATQWIPLANIGYGTTTQSQALGLEARKATEWGTQLTLGVSLDRSQTDTGAANADSTTRYLKLSQGLLRSWGVRYNRATLTRAETQANKQALLVEQGRQDLILSAIQRYHDVALAGKALSQSRESMARSQHHLEAARSRQSVGLVSKVDVYRAELALLNAESAHEAQIRAQERALEAFNELIGRGMADAAHVDAAEIAPLAAIVPANWEQQLPDAHLSWSAYLLEKSILDLDLYVAQRALLPDLSFNLSVARAGNATTPTLSQSQNSSTWSAQLQLRSTFDNFQERTALAQAQLREQQFNREGDALKRQIMRNVREAQAELRSAEKRILIAHASQKQSEQALDLAKFRYERGLSDNVDLLDSEAAFSAAQIERLRAVVNANLAAARLAHAMSILNLEWLQGAMQFHRSASSGEN